MIKLFIHILLVLLVNIFFINITVPQQQSDFGINESNRVKIGKIT